MASTAVQSGLQLYLRQINRSPLLKAAEEKALARRIIQDNDPAAREQMVRSNLRLVVNIAKNYTNRGLALPDLIEEGNIGLLKAVEGFNPENGCRFTTYASWWIKQAIKRALINSVQPIHIPAYMVEMIAKLKQANREMEDKLGRLPSTRRTLAAHEDVPQESADHPPGRPGVPFAHPVRHRRRRDDDQRTGGRRRNGNPRPDLPATTTNCSSSDVMLATIDERAAKILKLRYGLDGGDPLTLKEIGEKSASPANASARSSTKPFAGFAMRC